MRSKILTLVAVVSITNLAFAQSPGEPVFKKNCVMCHGADGAGKTKMGQKLGAADLTSNDVQSMSDEALAQSVRNGNGKMPSFEKTLSPEEITSVIQYIRTLKK